MRTALWGFVMAGGALAASLSLYTGCGALPDDCRERFNCTPGIGGNSTATSTSTSASSGAGGDSGPPAQCVPTAGQDAVADTCGLFVSASKGNDTTVGAGTKSKPYKTLTAAVAAAMKTRARIYACAETFTESVTVTVGLGIYGGLDCQQAWIYPAATRTTLTTGADAVPLTLTDKAMGVELFDFKVQAADALLAGGSSIAVIADQVTASFTRCDLAAGNGKDGAAGTTSPGTWPVSTSTEIRGNSGANACSDANKVSGALPKENALCMLAANPLGGAGGDGFPTFGTNGQAILANPQTAVGGTGQAASDPTMNCVTGSGQPGAPGTPGGDGTGAIGVATIGQLGISGYTGIAGKDGVDGKPGQGGGGGGGAKGKSGCAGASGGGGGAGGCGGQGGAGGKAGGASIALMSLGATLALDKVTIMLGAGGAGGDGGDAQSGGPGGIGGQPGAAMGTGTFAACPGGIGGPGGDGGKGGGGRGGHAIGIAVSGGAAPDVKSVMFSQKGTPGLGGKGGPAQNGDPGVQASVQLFP
jgi:hypothetical protein